MHWSLWILISIILFVIIIFLGIRIYLFIFLKKVIRANNEILSLLKNGLLKSFQENKPYDEVKGEYFKLIDMLEIFSQYVHFLSLMEEKKFDRISDCLTVQYLEENGRKIARIHLRAFPIRSLTEKLKPKQSFIDAFKISEEILKEKKDLNFIELITHNKVINESVVKRIIARYKLQLNYTIDNNYDIGYFPWIYSEWLMIHGGTNPKSSEVYSNLHKINSPVYIKLTRA